MTNHRPPDTYVSLTQAIEKDSSTRYNVIGVCVDHLPPSKSRGTDETITFTLSDPNWLGGLGMKFRFFEKTKSRLPAIENNGDIVILKNMTTRGFGGSLFGLSNHASSWFVLPASSVSDSKCADGSDIQVIKSPGNHNISKITSTELQYAKIVASQADPSSFRAPARATSLQIENIMSQSGGTPPPRKDKWRLLQDLQLDRNNSAKFQDGRPAFADLFGEVRRIYAGDYSRVDLHLTDYTSNPKFYSYEPNPVSRDGDEFAYIGNHKSWPGPWGKMTIEVHLWDSHAAFAKAEIKEKMFVLVKNCRIKVDPNGSKLEGACHGDQNDSSKVNIVVYQPYEVSKDERFKELLRRKRDYEKDAVKKGLMNQPRAEEESQKRQKTEKPNGGTSTVAQEETRKSRVRSRKLGRKAKQQAAANAAAKDGDKELFPRATTGSINQHIRCTQIEVPVTPIEKILDVDILERLTPNNNRFHLPFQNCAYKCKVKVVGYYPDDISEFAVPCEKFPYSSSDDDQQSNSSRIQDNEDLDIDFDEAPARADSVKWEWRFMLVVEDATPSINNASKSRLPVLVAGLDGDYLLRDVACNLKQEGKVLAAIRERLFLLWGDLQEQKEEAQKAGQSHADLVSSSLPFECLIKEYGVPYRVQEGAPANVETGHQRLFRLFGTTII